MATSRRSFLKKGTIGLVAAAVPAVLGNVSFAHPLGVSGLFTNDAGSVFKREEFLRHVNTTFLVKDGARSISLKLNSVKDHKAASKNPSKIAGKESFSLLFNRTGKGSALPQETYLLKHPQMGSFRLFLVPVGKRESKIHEAVIVQV